VSTRPFRFAVQSYAAESAAGWREQARSAEALGYATFHVADHVLGPGPAIEATNHPIQNVAAVPAIAVAAEATSTIGVGCRVFCCDYRNPVMLAKELATLDFFSEGRLEIGLGAGWLQGEYEAIGVPWNSPGARLDRLEETIALVKTSFAPGQLDIRGKHVTAVGFEALPKPVVRASGSGPKLLIGGGAKRVLGIAGREADIVSLNFNNASGKIGPAGIGSSTASATEEKIGWIKAGAGQRFGELELEIGAYFVAVTNDRSTALETFSGPMGLSVDDVAAHPHAFVGSVDDICDQLMERRERYGISYVTVGVRNMVAFAPVVSRLSGA
jgi:probable F420-dependent oxidoreductase